MNSLLKNKPKDGFEFKKMMRVLTQEIRLKAQAEGKIKKVNAQQKSAQ